MTTPTPADQLRDRIVQAARSVPLRLGPNAVAMTERGKPVILNLTEADAVVSAVLAALPMSGPCSCGGRFPLHHLRADAHEPAPAPEFQPCRTTRHCADHGWCRRCDPEFADVMARVNKAVQDTDPESRHWGRLYGAIAAELRQEPAVVARQVLGTPTTDPTPDDGTCAEHGPDCRVVDWAPGQQPAPAPATPADQATEEPVRGELWSLLDWTFWGSGMGDVFREPLADTMLAAITPEQLRQAEALMEQWHNSGHEPVGRRQYEALSAEVAELREAAEAHRLALSEALGLGTGAPWDAIRDRAADLRLADEAQPTETERCTCADAGPEFAPAGHYADCPHAATAATEEHRPPCGDRDHRHMGPCAHYATAATEEPQR